MSAFNGSGVFVISGSGLPYVAGTTISSTVANTLDSDLATGLSNTICKDGQTTPTGNIPLGGFKLTGVGSPTAAGDALIYGTTAANAVKVNSGKPAFLAFRNAVDPNKTGAGLNPLVAFNATVFDTDTNFSASVFTAPVTGKYRFSAGIRVSNLTVAMTNQQVQISTTARSYVSSQDLLPIAGGSLSLGISVTADMTAGDTAGVNIQFSGGAGNTATIFGDATTLYTFFSGELVA